MQSESSLQYHQTQSNWFRHRRRHEDKHRLKLKLRNLDNVDVDVDVAIDRQRGGSKTARIIH